MQYNPHIPILFAIICFGCADVRLKLNKNETVAFEGDELIINVENPENNKGRLELCFGSRPDAVNKYCPQGYGYVLVNIRGELIVTFHCLVIISAFLLYCCWYKKRNQQPAQVHRTNDDIQQADESLPQAVAKSAVHSLPKRLASAPGTAPNRTSTSPTKASDEKPRVVAPKPSSTNPVVSPFDPVSLTSTQITTPGVTTMPNSNASKKSRRRALPASGHVERSLKNAIMYYGWHRSNTTKKRENRCKFFILIHSNPKKYFWLSIVVLCLWSVVGLFREMQFSSIILLLAAVLCSGRAEVQLNEGKNSTVIFEGNELIIKVDNPQSNIGRLELCFGSRPDVANEFCPQGFGYVVVNILERTETYKLNRHGKLAGMGGVYRIGGGVVFNPDGSISVLVIEVPNGMTVSLPNAHLPVTTTTTSTPEKKAANSNATLIMIFGVVLLILILVIISAFLLYCCWYKKRNHRPAQLHQTHDKTREADKLPPPTAAKSTVHSLPKRLASAPGTAPNRTSTSTTKASDEKPRVVVAPKPSSTTPVVSPFDPVSLPSAQMSTPGGTTRLNSNASKKSRRRALTTSRHVERSVECSSIFQDYGNDSASNSPAELSHHGK
uniref:Uncharacterized protein n=1 Tax=Panagrellus redivivus TaxID=6233 RepID=A0A7E4V8U7_PANRE